MVMAPKDSDLVLSGFTWLYRPIDNGLVVHVRGVVTNVGTDPMNITRAHLIVDNKEYPLEFRRIENLEPNDVREFNGKTIIKEFPETNLLTIIVEYCTPRECSESITNARLDSMAFVINKDIFGVTTVTVPQTVTTWTVTQTETVTTTVSATTTITQTYTETTTVTQTATVTATTTVVQNKPTWPIAWEACYGIDDYVYGTLLKPVDEKESIPYVVKFYDCTILGCSLLAVKPFKWVSKSSFEAKYYLPDPKPLHSYKIEIWSVNWTTGKFIDKVYEQTIDMLIRCA